MCLIQNKWAEIKIWVTLTKAKLLWQGNRVRIGLWVAPSQQWWEFINSGPRRDKPQTSDRVLGAQCEMGVSMHEGNEGYPIWSVPTKDLLMMIIWGICHNVVADQSEHLWWPLPTVKSTYNRHASTGTGCWRSRRRSPGSMSPIYFYLMWTAVFVCSVYLGKRWHQDALWDKDKSVEAVWYSGQCSAGTPWV